MGSIVIMGSKTLGFPINSTKVYNALNNLENKYEIKSIWEEITTTTGTITTYANLGINQRDWFQGQYNAKVVSVTLSGEPEDKSVYTSSGKEVKAVIEIDGTYTLSGLPTALNYGIIWQVTGTAKDFGLAEIPESKIIAEYDDASPFTRVDTTIQPLFNGDNINLLNGGLKDTNVINAIKLGDLDNTSFISENKSMVGSFNELWKIANVSQTITVAKDGTGNFSTIQEAIDFITDATSDKRYAILIKSGTFTENVILKNYIYLYGDNTYINGTLKGGNKSSGIIGMGFLINNPTTDMTLIDCSDGGSDPLSSFFAIRTAFIITITNADKVVTLIKGGITSGVFSQTTVFYNNLSTSAITKDTNLIENTGNGDLFFSVVDLRFNSYQSSGNINIINDSSIKPFINIAGYNRINLSNANWNGIVTFYNNLATTIETKSFGSSFINLKSSGQGYAKIIRSDSNGCDIVLSGVQVRASGFTEVCNADAVTVNDRIDINFCTFPLGSVFCGFTDSIKRVYRDNGYLKVNTEIVDENTYIGNATNKSLQDMFNIGFCAGWVSGASCIDNLDGTVTITAGTGQIRVSDTEQSELKSFDHVAYTTNINAIPNSLTIQENQENYIYVDYNNGSPVIKVSTTSEDILLNENNVYELYEIIREGTSLHISDHKQRGKNVTGKLQKYLYSKNRIERSNTIGGLILSSSVDGNRYVSMTASLVWIKLNETIIDAINTSGSDVFDRYYQTSPNVFAKTQNNRTWDNLHYNNINTGLVTLGNNRYCFQDFWIDADGDLVSVYANNEYVALASAESAPISTAPLRVREHALYIGRIVFQKGGTLALAVLSPFAGLNLSPTTTSIHNYLAGLQGGTLGEYYHHTLAEYSTNHPYKNTNNTYTGQQQFDNYAPKISITPTLNEHAVRKDYVDLGLSTKENAIIKNSAFNKDFGIVTDTVCQGNDSRLSDSRVPTPHNLGGAEHVADTLANLNLKISDATLIDTNDSRLSDSRKCNNTFDDVSTSRTNLSVYSDSEVDTLLTGKEDTFTKNTAFNLNLENDTNNIKMNGVVSVGVLNTIARADHTHSSDTSKEDIFSKNTAFNKDFGSLANTVCQGNDSRLSDSRKCDNTFDNISTAKTNLLLNNVNNTSDATKNSASVALTNKTINADNNTLSNIELDNLKTGILETDLANVSLLDNTIPSAKATKKALDLKVAISDVTDALNSTSATNPLSANQGKILKELIDLLQGSLIPQGSWDASTNTPDISSETITGKFWIVSVDGNTDIGGITDWLMNDWVVKTVTGWAKVDNTDKINSINGYTSPVIVLSTTDIAEGARLYYTDTRVDARISNAIGNSVQAYNSNTVIDANYAHTDNNYTTTEKNKLSGIETGAEVNNISDVNALDLIDGGESTLHYHSSDRNRSNHTGTQTASTIIDFNTEVSNNTDVTLNTTHRGLTNNPHNVTKAQLNLDTTDTPTFKGMTATDGNIAVTTDNVNKYSFRSDYGICPPSYSNIIRQIWSIGSPYFIDSSLSWGNLYGVGYAFNGAGKTDAPIVNGQHQICFAAAGTVNAAISLTNGGAYFKGNVGIGIKNPAKKFEVVGGSSALEQEPYSADIFAGGFPAGWSVYGSGYDEKVRYTKDSCGRVSFKGMIKRSLASVNYDNLFTLPVGYRPFIENEYFWDRKGDFAIRIDINGVVAGYCYAANGACSFAGFSFPTHKTIV